MCLLISFLDELRRRYHRRAEMARAEAEAANRIKDDFLATVSHELRTPLAAIIGWTQILRTHGMDREASAQALETIERSAKTESQLVEDLLDVSRISAGQLRDTGRGIEPDLLPYVFERFRQGSDADAKRHGGLGLGLSIARQLVELHGGTIRAESDGLGRGARFTVELPLVADKRGVVAA